MRRVHRHLLDRFSARGRYGDTSPRGVSGMSVHHTPIDHTEGIANALVSKALPSKRLSNAASASLSSPGIRDHGRARRIHRNILLDLVDRALRNRSAFPGGVTRLPGGEQCRKAFIVLIRLGPVLASCARVRFLKPDERTADEGDQPSKLPYCVRFCVGQPRGSRPARW